MAIKNRKKNSSNFKVLMIDDSAIFTEIFVEYLSKYYICTAINDYFEIMIRIKKFNPDLVLLDVYMPWVNGLDLLTNIKNECPKAKVVMLSSNDEHLQKAIALGAEQFLVKPIRAPLLKEEIDKVLISKN